MRSPTYQGAARALHPAYIFSPLRFLPAETHNTALSPMYKQICKHARARAYPHFWKITCTNHMCRYVHVSHDVILCMEICSASTPRNHVAGLLNPDLRLLPANLDLPNHGTF